MAALTAKQWQHWARAHRLPTPEAAEVSAVLQPPQLLVPAHVVRAKACLVQALLAQLAPTLRAVEEYREAVARFFATLPAAEGATMLPAGGGTTVPQIWVELGDAPGR